MDIPYFPEAGPIIDMGSAQDATRVAMPRGVLMIDVCGQQFRVQVVEGVKGILISGELQLGLEPRATNAVLITNVDCDVRPAD